MSTEDKILKLLEQIQVNMDSMQSDISGIKSDVIEIKSKINFVYEQTSDLTEFRTLVSTKLTTVSNDIKFIKHKVRENEEDLFAIQNHLSIIE